MSLYPYMYNRFYKPKHCKNYKKYDKSKCRCKVDGSVRHCKCTKCAYFEPRLKARVCSWIYYL